MPGGRRPREKRRRPRHHVHPGLPGAEGLFSEEAGAQTESRPRMELL